MVTKDNISQKYQLSVPVEGRRHDVTMLRLSGLMPVLENFSFGTQHERLCIYGDPAYPLRWYSQA